MWKKRTKKKSHRLIITLLTILVIFFGFAFISNKLGLFTIKKIDTTMQNISCTDEDNLISSSNLLGEIIFKVRNNNTELKLKNQFYCIKHIEITYVFPSKVKITATGRQPFAVLLKLNTAVASASANLENIATPSASESSDSFLMDDEGVIFSKDSGGLSIPLLFIEDGNLSFGQKPQEINIENTLEILGKLTVFGIKTQKALILTNSLIIFSDPKIIFKVDEKIDIQLASLQLILQEAKINSRKLEFIDLRFDKPIVRFAPKIK